MINQAILPELKSGMNIITSTGYRATVIRTRKTNDYGERYVRLRFKAQVRGEWKLPEVESSTLWTREDLQADGVRLEAK